MTYILTFKNQNPAEGTIATFSVLYTTNQTKQSYKLC